VLGQGRDFGPDLSKVGSRLTKPQILASLLRPSEVIDPRFRGIVIETNDNQIQIGFPAERRSTEILLKLPTGQVSAIPVANIRKEEALPASLMPEQLLQSLTPRKRPICWRSWHRCVRSAACSPRSYRTGSVREWLRGRPPGSTPCRRTR